MCAINTMPKSPAAAQLDFVRSSHTARAVLKSDMEWTHCVQFSSVEFRVPALRIRRVGRHCRQLQLLFAFAVAVAVAVYLPVLPFRFFFVIFCFCYLFFLKVTSAHNLRATSAACASDLHKLQQLPAKVASCTLQVERLKVELVPYP